MPRDLAESLDRVLHVKLCSRLPDHKYKVTLVVDARKMRANGEGAELAIPIHDPIEVGVFKGKKDKEQPLHTEKV